MSYFEGDIGIGFWVLDRRDRFRLRINPAMNIPHPVMALNNASTVNATAHNSPVKR